MQLIGGDSNRALRCAWVWVPRKNIKFVQTTRPCGRSDREAVGELSSSDIHEGIQVKQHAIAVSCRVVYSSGDGLKEARAVVQVLLYLLRNLKIILYALFLECICGGFVNIYNYLVEHSGWFLRHAFPPARSLSLGRVSPSAYRILPSFAISTIPRLQR
jgi:hypothetical protein